VVRRIPAGAESGNYAVGGGRYVWLCAVLAAVHQRSVLQKKQKNLRVLTLSDRAQGRPGHAGFPVLAAERTLLPVYVARRHGPCVAVFGVRPRSRVQRGQTQITHNKSRGREMFARRRYTLDHACMVLL
jgi:hypothetical protein